MTDWKDSFSEMTSM